MTTPWQRASLGDLVDMTPEQHFAGGDETAPFTPDWADEPANGRHAGPERIECGCGLPGCPDMPPPFTLEVRAVLSYAPGVVDRMSRERVRNGQYEDIPACFRVAGLRVHKPAVDN